MAGCQEGTQRSHSVVHADHVSIRPECESPRTASNSATFSPFHLPSLPAGRPAQEKSDSRTVSVGPPALDCLEVSALRQRFVKTRIFLFLFSHHSIVILRSLMDQ